MTLDILCKVVDNYGDIGVVYRLAKALTETDPELRLRLHVDDLEAFHALCPAVDPSRRAQVIGSWTVLRWDLGRAELAEACAPDGQPSLVVECFACGRPTAFEELLFDPARPDARLVVNLEHLTAETWADELHRMLSATRNALVRKYIFMPGFAEATGGLLIDRGFDAARSRWTTARGEPAHADGRRAPSADIPPPALGVELGSLRLDLARRAGLALPSGGETMPWIVVFTYERKFRSLVEALSGAARIDEGAGAESTPLVLAAPGRSATPLLAAWEEAGRPFPLLPLPFLAQEQWDELLLACDLALVRGEESLARAALAGGPFLWHAYRQDENHQLVKVRALIDRMRPSFGRAGVPESAFAAYEALSLAWNDRLADGPEAGGDEPVSPFLAALPLLRPGFEAFAAELRANGNLADKLLDFIRERLRD